MKNFKSIIVALVVFIGIFSLVFILYKVIAKPTYICTDTTNNVQYTFDNEDDMNIFCDNLSKNDDSVISSFNIYNDLINNNDNRFSFYPYLDSSNNLIITIVIVDCNNPEDAKNKAIEWFGNHSYNINDYKVEFEYPCE